MVISRNLVVFALAGLAMLAAGYIPLPGIDLVRYAGPDAGSAVAQVSIFALGVQPVLTALMLVELGKLFMKPKDEHLEGASVPTPMIVRLLALGISAVDAYAIAGHFEASGYVRPDFTWFMPVAIACFVAATAFALFLVDRVQLAGFPNGIWALAALQVASVLPVSAWQTGELMIVGAISYKLVLMGLVYLTLCVAAVVFVTGLWNGLGSKDGRPLSRGILIWPVVLAVFATSILVESLNLAQLIFVASGALQIYNVVFQALFALFIALFVFAYARRSRIAAVPPARVAIVASLIAIVQMALVVSSEPIIRLYALPLIPGGQSLLALVLTAIGIGALKVPVIFPEADGARPEDMS